MTHVQFLTNCGNDIAGECKAIDSKRAKRLAWTGYVRILEPEDTTVAAETGTEKAIKFARGTRTERRG